MNFSYLRLSYTQTKKKRLIFMALYQFDPVKMSQQKINQNVYQTSDTQKMIIILFIFLSVRVF